MNPTKLATLVSLALAMSLSGCIAEADATFAQWEEDWAEEVDDWESDMDHHDHYEGDPEDCPEDDADEASGNHTHDQDEEEDDADEETHDDGDVTASDLDNAYTDADTRFQNEIVGTEDSERTVRVGLGDDTLRIGIVYHLHGSVEITVRDPLGFKIAQEEFDGSKETQEDNWVDIEHPLPGDYDIEIEIDGSGGYTIGAYLDE